MDKWSTSVKTIADLGCGSGILSLIALKLGAKKTFSIDIDSVAIESTRINSALNGFPENLLNVVFGSIEELEKHITVKKIDLMLCNILVPVIKSLSPSFEKIIGYKGQVILSGLLVDQIKEFKDFLFPLGREVLDIKIKDQWT